MKKHLLLTPLIVLAMLVMASSAGADQRLAHTCNSSGAYAGVTGLGIAFLGNVHDHARIVENFDYQCGHGGSVEWELQGKVNGVWTDEANRRGASIDRQLVNHRGSTERFFTNTSHTLRECTERHGDYRLVVYDATGVHTIEHDFSESCE